MESECIVPFFSTGDSIISGQPLESADPVEIPTTIPTYPPTPLDPIIPPTDSDTIRVVVDEPPDLRVSTAGRVPHGPSSGLVLVRRNSFGQRISLDSNPSISIASSFIPPMIPPEPWISLSFLGEEKLQIQLSETEATDLNMRSCVFGLGALGNKLIFRCQPVMGFASATQVRGPAQHKKIGRVHTRRSVGYRIRPCLCMRSPCTRNGVLSGRLRLTCDGSAPCETGPNRVGVSRRAPQKRGLRGHCSSRGAGCCLLYPHAYDADGCPLHPKEL